MKLNQKLYAAIDPKTKEILPTAEGDCIGETKDGLMRWCKTWGIKDYKIIRV